MNYAPPGLTYLTDTEHLERMARAIYLSSHRRVGIMLRGWDQLPEDAREGFRDIAQVAIHSTDELRRRAIASSSGFQSRL